MTRMVLLTMLVGCAEQGTWSQPGPDPVCASTTRVAASTGDILYEKEYLADGRVRWERRTYYDESGDEWAVYTIESGYVDGLLVSVLETADGENDFYDERLLVHTFDEDRLLVASEEFIDGTPWTVRTQEYDDEGQHVYTLFDHLEHDGLDQENRITWVHGRQVSTEHRFVGGEYQTWESRDYLAPSPSPDVEVTSHLLGTTTRMIYDERGLLAEKVVSSHEGPVGTVPEMVQHFGHRDDGQLLWQTSESIEPGAVLRRTEWSYDDAGHVLSRISGPDADRDGTIDEVESEQTWSWSCDR